MRVMAGLVEGTWPACVDAVRSHAPDPAEAVLLHVSGPAVPGLGHGAFAGLLGRGHPERHPGDRMAALGGSSAAELLAAAAERLGRPCTREERSGRVEREVVAAAEGADLLVPTRAGDRSPLGPRATVRRSGSRSTTRRSTTRRARCGRNGPRGSAPSRRHRRTTLSQRRWPPPP